MEEKTEKIEEKPDKMEVEKTENMEQISGTDAEDKLEPELEELVGKSEPKKGFLERKGKEEPFLPFPEEHIQGSFKLLRNFFGIKDDFPINQLMVRSLKNMKIYFMTKDCRGLFQADSKEQLRIVNAGVKLFAKHDAKGTDCTYRIAQEGLHWLMPYITKRVLTITEKDFIRLLQVKDVSITQLEPETQAAAQKILSTEGNAGSVVYSLSPKSTKFAGLSVTGWLSKHTVHLLVKKKEIDALKKLMIDEGNFASSNPIGKEEVKNEEGKKEGLVDSNK